MNKKILLISVVVIVSILLSFVGGTTFAKYISKNKTSASLEVAKWSITEEFFVNGQSSTSGNLNLASTYDESTLVNGKIAPGSAGNFALVIDATDTETGVNYEVTFDNISGEKPENLIFIYRGEEYMSLEELSDDLKGSIPANVEEKVLSLEIGWSWAYETKIDGNTEVGDTQDTSDGQNISQYNFDVTITCTQEIPQDLSLQ